MSRSLTAVKANPGGTASAFCEDVSSRSNPQASKGRYTPLNDETASTRIKVSGLTFRTHSDIA